MCSHLTGLTAKPLLRIPCSQQKETESGGEKEGRERDRQRRQRERQRKRVNVGEV